jgi:pyruvate,orthophosphate dikinase
VVPALDDDAFVLLHEIRLRGLMTIDGDTTHLVVLLEEGWIAESPRGMRITAEGRTVHTELARLPPASDDEATARRSYERFLPLNKELIRICNDWQVKPGNNPNDHTDVPYDWEVIDRLKSLDDRAAPVIARLSRVAPRFGIYRPRLQTAIEKIDAGEHEWMTSPRIDSYHTVWMLLHEDLLLALGEDRTTEPEQ